jgi:Glutaminase
MAPVKETGILTVAAIRKPKGKGETEYLFNERQRIFTLRATMGSAEESAGRLEEAFRKKVPVRALLDPRRGFIQRIDMLSPEEIDEFQRLRTLLDKPDRTVPIDVSSIDPTTFNIVDHYLKVPTFRLCTRIIPNYKSAKKMFDFCAKQSCDVPGPYSISPCIPFQYVRDGCYARAHKMRWIITSRYRYCCEKVFSFANKNNDRLAVKADKWGGCCVTWWYHVAPLIRVRVRVGGLSVVLALVIDPGMFDKPVLLSTWLAAQENKGCDPSAKVSMYSIQPGSAYSPANFAGTAFATDPSYTATDATLTAYHSLTTCP